MSAITNRRSKDRKRRKRLREKLLAAGLDEQAVDTIIDRKRNNDRVARERLRPTPPTREEILANTDDSLWPDDKGYKPAPGDPLLRGPARADGMTAKVLRRRSTITKFQYDREVER